MLIATLAVIALSSGVVLVPVLAGLGIYVASAIFITGFMLCSAASSFATRPAPRGAVPVVTFMLFERYFLVPLPKGPLESRSASAERPT